MQSPLLGKITLHCSTNDHPICESYNSKNKKVNIYLNIVAAIMWNMWNVEMCCFIIVWPFPIDGQPQRAYDTLLFTYHTIDFLFIYYLILYYNQVPLE